MAPEYLEKQQVTCPQGLKSCHPTGWPKGNPKWTKQQAIDEPYPTMISKKLKQQATSNDK